MTGLPTPRPNCYHPSLRRSPARSSTPRADSSASHPDRPSTSGCVNPRTCTNAANRCCVAGSARDPVTAKDTQSYGRQQSGLRPDAPARGLTWKLELGKLVDPDVRGQRTQHAGSLVIAGIPRFERSTPHGRQPAMLLAAPDSAHEAWACGSVSSSLRRWRAHAWCSACRTTPRSA